MPRYTVFLCLALAALAGCASSRPVPERGTAPTATGQADAPVTIDDPHTLWAKAQYDRFYAEYSRRYKTHFLGYGEAAHAHPDSARTAAHALAVADCLRDIESRVLYAFREYHEEIRINGKKSLVNENFESVLVVAATQYVKPEVEFTEEYSVAEGVTYSIVVASVSRVGRRNHVMMLLNELDGNLWEWLYEFFEPENARPPR